MYKRTFPFRITLIVIATITNMTATAIVSITISIATTTNISTRNTSNHAANAPGPSLAAAQRLVQRADLRWNRKEEQLDNIRGE